MSHPAGKRLPFPRGKRHVLGQVVEPLLFEGQVSLLGFGDDLSILEQLDGDLRRVEFAHVTDEGVGRPQMPRSTAVHLHLGRSYRETELSHVYRNNMTDNMSWLRLMYTTIYIYNIYMS